MSASGIRSWLKSWIPGESPKGPPGKDWQIVVTDSLLLELETQLRELEQHYWDLEQEERRLQTGVDYSWLVCNETRAYQIPQVDRMQLVSLCQQVKPDECSWIIKSFRDSLMREPALNEVTVIFKAIILQILQQRPKEETFTEWVSTRTASLINNIKFMRPSPQVSPANDHIDIERQEECYPLSSLDSMMYYKNGAKDIYMFQNSQSQFI